MIGQLLTGRYLILEKLGAGGFSETYLARDKYLPHHPLCVAKCLKLSPTNPIPLVTAQRLFQTEAQILDELGQHHAQIPTLLAYSHEQEMPYQIQQYVVGKNLGQCLTQGYRLNSEAAIALLVDVLPVLQSVHAHQIIHRDIKPSNLIHATELNRIVLIDFGVACRMQLTPAGWKPMGEDADLAIGTPGFMPPEQQSAQLQFSSDLYALGVSIIFMLTGIHPRQLEPNPITGELEWQVHLGGRSIHPGLAMILSGMVRSSVRDRFSTVAEVIAAMTAFASFPSEPPATSATPATSAHPVILQAHQSVKRDGARWLRQSLIVTGLVGGLLGAGTWGLQHQATSNWMTRMGWQSVHAPSPLTQLGVLKMPSAVDSLVMLPGENRLVTAHVDHRLRVWSKRGTLLKTLSGHRDQISALAFSRDGEWLLSGGRDRLVYLWHLTSGPHPRAFKGHATPVTAVAFSPDARAIASGGQDGTVRVWQRQTGCRQQTLARDGAAITALTYGNSNLLISANTKFELQIWNLQTRRLQRTFAGHTAPIRQLHMIDADTLVSVGDDRSLVWHLTREELLRASPQQSNSIVAAVIRDRTVMTLDQQGTLQSWSLDTGEIKRTGSSVLRPMQAAWSSNGRYLAAWSRDRQFSLWQQSNPL